MADIRTALSDAKVVPDAPPQSAPTHIAVRREDYRPPDWLVPEIRLDFALDAERTVATATLVVERNGDHQRPLRLDGTELELVSLKVDGEAQAARFDSGQLVVDLPGKSATIETQVAIGPAANT